MTPTATATKTLEERLTEAKQALRDADRTLGAVAHDNGDWQAAHKRVSDARALVESLRAAQTEDVRRAEAEAVAEEQRREAVKRWTFTAWHAEYVERMGPVLQLRAKLEAAEAHAMELDDLGIVMGDVYLPLHQWIDQEVEAGRLERFDLPQTTTSRMRLHGAHAHCNGEVLRAQAGDLSAADQPMLVKRLTALVAAAAKPLGKDARPENLPWARGDKKATLTTSEALAQFGGEAA
jgi:hypothetical protein